MARWHWLQWRPWLSKNHIYNNIQNDEIMNTYISQMIEEQKIRYEIFDLT